MSLAGVIDIHAHCGPDSMPRTIDGIDLAKLARDRGMRGLVLKSHYEPTATLAYLARKMVPGIEVYGGIALNRSVGGVNAVAVERMSMVAGGWGRFVWMPTFDSEAQVRYSKEQRPFVSVSRDGQLLPEVKDVIEVIARRGLILETGHSSGEECLMLIREARRQGVGHIVVTHAMMAPIHMTVAQMQEAASSGAFIEFVYNGLIGPYKEFDVADYALAIRELGVDSVILAGDLGQPVNPLHPDGLVSYFDGLRGAGFTDEELGVMTRENPRQVLER
ncbi:MAG TPA: DUF6282 family protein [Bryobacteraceae bacterium]|jgi:hypothetical protein